MLSVKFYCVNLGAIILEKLALSGSLIAIGACVHPAVAVPHPAICSIVPPVTHALAAAAHIF